MGNKKAGNAAERFLTEVELELMTLIWALGKATVKDVHAALSQKRPLAYTTVATVMKVLEQKNFLKCEKDSFAHIFVPLVSKSDYEGTCLDHMVSHFFDGEPVALVQRLLSDKRLSKDDAAAIEKTLKELAFREKKKK